MDQSNTTKPIIPPMESDPAFKRYHCPHCSRFLFKGNVQGLKMVCPHCQKMIHSKEQDLFPAKTDE